MVNIADILDLDALERMIAEKRIGKQIHPTLPLVIYNYTNAAQFANKWTNEERVCRGLIVGPGGEVIARGPSKFFNYGQPGAPEPELDTKVWVTRKEDGSLGIGYHYLGHFGVATRGSFASEQAIHATNLLNEEEKARILLENKKGRTPIWEIVYPENRIVLDYGSRDELIHIGGVRLDNGIISLRPMSLFMSIRAGRNPEMTFADALALPIPDDQEGYVIDVLESYENGARLATGHIKLKGDRYKELHGAIFGLSERKIWEAMGRGDDMEEFVASLPDELIPWAQGVVDRIGDEWENLILKVSNALREVLRHFDAAVFGIPRGDLARYIIANHKEISGPLFSLVDQRPDAVVEWAHKQIKPEHRLFRVESQENN